MKQIFEWIPVEDRLPEIVTEDGSSDYILLSFDNYNLPAIGRYEEDEDGDGNFFEGDEDRSCSSYGFFVNAWMPLPERWKEEG
jgi:hypothetical protein